MQLQATHETHHSSRNPCNFIKLRNSLQNAKYNAACATECNSNNLVKQFDKSIWESTKDPQIFFFCSVKCEVFIVSSHFPANN